MADTVDTDEAVFLQKKKPQSKKFKTETGGLQEKKVRVELSKEEIKAEQKAIKEKRRDKVKERKRERVGLIRRIRDIGGELRKVRWPTFGQTVKQTGVVLGVVVIFSLVVFGLDQGLSQLYKLLTKGLA